jgi:hypothetical protein
MNSGTGHIHELIQLQQIKDIICYSAGDFGNSVEITYEWNLWHSNIYNLISYSLNTKNLAQYG